MSLGKQAKILSRGQIEGKRGAEALQIVCAQSCERR